MTEPILALHDVHSYIQQHHILQGVSLNIKPGRSTVLLGRNGAGKSSVLRAVMGLNPITSGEVHVDGTPVQGLKPYEITRLGVGFVAEERAVFYNLTVEENIRLSILSENEETLTRQEMLFELFSDLKKFWKTKAGVLSGGQKQMLAVARAIINDHKLLLIDEPSKGLAPIVVDQLGESLIKIGEKTSIVLVEQNFHLASMIGTDYFILDDGRVVHQGIIKDLADNHELKKKYLGIG